MKTFSYLLAVAAMAAAAPSMAGSPPAKAPACQSTHTPGTSLVCELYRSDVETLMSGGEVVSKRILLPLNTTIDDNELPSYFIAFNTEGSSGRVRVSMKMSDDAGGHAIELGSSESTVHGGGDRVAMSASGHRFAQPGHLTVGIERIDEGSGSITLTDMIVVQTDPEVEAISLFGRGDRVPGPRILH